MFGSFRCLRTMASRLPHFAEGEVVRGFGRGSKELGIPTANFPEHVVENLPAELVTGVYFGWGSVDCGPVRKMVMSIGWNPFYNNKTRSMETHLMDKFPEDFYGSHLKIIMVGFIRPEKNFDSLDDLISAIKADIAEAEEKLELPEYSIYKQNNFFKSVPNGRL